MKNCDDFFLSIRPIILAGGLGTRLRPRTNYLPKPLLPVDGRPMLWYVLNIISSTNMLPPIVALSYKAELIRCYFQRDNILFCDLPNRTMAEAFFEVSEKDTADAFLGMSADVLIPKDAISEILHDYAKYKKDVVLFVKLPAPGHKKWEFIIEDEFLKDVRKKEIRTHFERVLLIITRKSLLKLRGILPKPIVLENLPKEITKFQTGWILILKVMLNAGIPIYARFIDKVICNINVPADFEMAKVFVKHYLK